MRKGALFAVLLALAGAAVPAKEKTAPFVIAVLRPDGLVTPFAAFDRRWRAPWPDTVFREALPITLSDVPDKWWGIDTPPTKMTLWRNGERGEEVTLLAPTMAKPMCLPRLALKSDFKAPGLLPPPMERPYPKEGLLVSSGVAVDRIVSVEKGSAEWNATVIRIKKDFDEAEDDAVGVFTHWNHPVKQDRRRLQPVTIEALYRAPADREGWTAYFVEAVRQYPPGPGDKDACGPATFASGWLLVGPKNEAKVRVRARITYCDRYGVSYMLPFGLITANDRKYWVYQYSGFELELYEVARPTTGGIESQVLYRAGACEP